LISNLEPGTSYIITIQGVGIAGDGDPASVTVITGYSLEVFKCDFYTSEISKNLKV